MLPIQRSVPVNIGFLLQTGESVSLLINIDVAFLMRLFIVLSIVSGKVVYDLIKAGV